MKSKVKKIMLSISIVLILLLIGISYAFFSYMYVGEKSEIITGEIYMNYVEDKIISLTNVFPESKEQALARNDKNGVFEFRIEGRNTSDYPIYYSIDIQQGPDDLIKTNRISPEHIYIYLECDGEPVVDGMKYSTWNNQKNMD